MADREQHHKSERREPPEQPNSVWGPVEGREAGLYDPDSDDQEEDAPIGDSA
jgi:hypothetical protein